MTKVTHGSRVKRGLQEARERGIVLGRPVNEANHERIAALLAKGRSMQSVIDELHVGYATVRRVLDKLQQ